MEKVFSSERCQNVECKIQERADNNDSKGSKLCFEIDGYAKTIATFKFQRIALDFHLGAAKIQWNHTNPKKTPRRQWS